MQEVTVGPFRRGDYEVTLHYRRGYERQECVGIDVRAVSRTAQGNNLTPIIASAFRALRIGELIDKHRPIEIVTVDTPGEEPVVIVLGKRGRGGRPPLYDWSHWVAVTNAYRNAYAAGKTPTRAVARRFKVAPSTAAKWVARCREFGLLPPTTRGRARSGGPPKKKRKGAR